MQRGKFDEKSKKMMFIGYNEATIQSLQVTGCMILIQVQFVLVEMLFLMNLLIKKGWIHHMVRVGFRRAHADHSLYVCESDTGIVVITIYVDDLIIVGDSAMKIDHVKVLLK